MKKDDQLPHLVAFEEKMMHQLPKKLARLRISSSAAFYIEHHGEPAWLAIKSAMVAKYKQHHQKK